MNSRAGYRDEYCHRLEREHAEEERKQREREESNAATRKQRLADLAA